MALERLSEARCFGGVQRRYKGASQVLSGDAVFSVFYPILRPLIPFRSSFISRDLPVQMRTP